MLIARRASGRCLRWWRGCLSFSVFEDKAAADASVSKAADWVRANLAALLPNPPQVTTGEVLFRDARAGQQAGYGVLRTYQIDAKDRDEISRRVEQGLVPIVREVPGYVSYLAVDYGNGRIGSASTFTDQAAAEASTRKAADWVRMNLSSLLPSAPEVEPAQILLRHVKS